MKTKIAFILSSAATIAFSGTSMASSVLVDWNLDTVTGPTDNNTEFTGVASSVATVGTNLSVSNLVTASSSGHAGLVWSSGNAGPNKLNLQRWDHPNDSPSAFGNGNGNPNNWLQFSLTASPGFQFTLTSVDISAWRNGGGAPANWSIETSTDAGDTWELFGSTHSESNAGDSVFRDVTFSDSLTESDLLIRFTAVGPTGGSGNLHLDTLVLNGTVVPEPSGVIVFGSLGLLTLFRRRR